MYEALSPAYPLVCYSGKWSRGEEENACHAPPSCPYGESRQRFPCAAPHPSLALTGERHSFSPFLWHATSLGTEEASRGKRSYRRCIGAGLIKYTPLWMEDFGVACPLVPSVPPLISGAWSSPRLFVPRCLQTLPHENALALPVSCGSTKTWTGDLHPRA
jgi:hypothetical protein